MAIADRWSYEQDRRDKRTVWHYVENAFPLCIDRIDPNAPPQGEPFKAVWGPFRAERLAQLRADSCPLKRGWTLLLYSAI